MNQKILQDLYERLEPSVDVNTGHSDDYVYGNYVEWKSLDEYDDDTLKDLQELFADKLPKKKYVKRSDIIAFLRRQGVPEETVYEGDVNFPDSQCYWQGSEEDYLYQQYEIAQDKYISEVNQLKNKIDMEIDELTIKAAAICNFQLD
jgi:hypothetical protein